MKMRGILSALLTLALVLCLLPHMATEVHAASNSATSGLYTLTLTEVYSMTDGYKNDYSNRLYKVEIKSISVGLDGNISISFLPYAYYKDNYNTAVIDLYTHGTSVQNSDCTQNFSRNIEFNQSELGVTWHYKGTLTRAAQASHTGGTATCVAKAACGVCSLAYGEPDSDAHYLSYSGGDKESRTITETCTNGCGHEATATLTEVGEQVYTGAPLTPGKVAYSEGWLGGELEIQYENNTEANDPLTSAYIEKDGAKASAAFRICPIQPTAAHFTFAPPMGLTYDGTAKTAQIEPIDSISGMGGFTVTYYRDGVKLENESPAAAGTYTVKIDVENGRNFTTADNITDASWTFTVAKADTVKTAPVAKENLVYDGTAQELSTEGVVSGAAESADYKMLFSIPDGGYSEEILTGTDAGTYTVNWHAGYDNDNFNMSRGEFTVTIAPAPLTVTPNPVTITYGETLPELEYTVSGAIGSEVPAFTGALSVSGTKVGEYPITAGTLALVDSGSFKAGNYTLTVTEGAKLTVNKKALTLTATGQTITYGGEIDRTKYTLDGLVEGDTATVTLTPSTANVTKSGTITAEITIKNAAGEDVTACYDIANTSGTLTINPDLSAIEGLTTENVTSADAEAINAVLKMIENADCAIEDSEEITEKCGDLLAKLEAVEKKNEELEQAAKAYDPATVNYAQQEEIQDLMKELEEQMASGNLTGAERAKLDLALENLEAADKRIVDSLKVLATEEIRDTLEVTPENVKPQQKEEIKKAIETIGNALNTYGGNYTAADREDLQEQAGNLKEALAVLERVENAEKAMNGLPGTADPDDETAMKAYADAKAAYDGLSGYEKSLVTGEAKQKLDGLYTALTNYRITKGNGGSWVEGSTKTLGFTANGPHSKFTGLKVDGRTVDPKHYTVAPGSTVITLKASCLDTLSVGKHTLRVEYTDGYVEGSFRVRSSLVPATGDSANLMLWTGLLLAAAASAAVLVNRSRKRKW